MPPANPEPTPGEKILTGSARATPEDDNAKPNTARKTHPSIETFIRHPPHRQFFRRMMQKVGAGVPTAWRDFSSCRRSDMAYRGGL